jgi:hypothetical protein
MADAGVSESAEVLAKTAMVAGEVLLPGASELIAGNIGSGVLHFVGTGLAVGLLAPTMPILAAAAAIGFRLDSYYRANHGQSLFSKVASTTVNSTVAPAPTAAGSTQRSPARSGSTG